MRKKTKTHFTPAEVGQRFAFESRFADPPKVDPAVLELLSGRGFAFCFMEIRDLYPTPTEAYERLERIHIQITGKRYYSSYHSFRRVLGRNLKSGWKR